MGVTFATSSITGCSIIGAASTGAISIGADSTTVSIGADSTAASSTVMIVSCGAGSVTAGSC